MVQEQSETSFQFLLNVADVNQVQPAVLGACTAPIIIM